MGNKAGLWIDHGKAVIVILTDKGEEIVYVTEGVGKQLRRKGESPMND